MKLFPRSITLINCLFFIAITGFFFPTAAQPPYENYQLVWSDEFDVDGLPDSENWGYEKGCSVRNNELQYYAEAREKNSRVEGGFLIIEAHRETMSGCNYTSANLMTMGKRSFKYGLFEIRAKIDIRKGSWPAWWWLPNSGGWPRGGEIDMMEFYSGKCLFNVMDGSQRWTSKTKTVDNKWAEEFHVWTWEWDSLKIDLWLDGVLMNHYPVANADGTGPGGENPFRRPGYMLVNQAIGGNNGGDPSGTTFPIRYVVDYVRHYLPGNDTTAPKVESVTASSGGSVTVLFSEAVDKTSAERISNYSIAAGGVTLSEAKLQSDGRTVVLTASELVIDSRNELTIRGVLDRAPDPNTLIAVTMEFTVVQQNVKLIGTVIGSGDPYNGASSVTYEKAVDGSTSTYADCIGNPVWVGYDFGEGERVVITGFRYYPRNGYADRMDGKSFEISTDGTAWEKVYTVSSAPPEGAFTTVSIAATKPVRYLRYNGTGGYLNVCEVEFWGFVADSSSAIFFKGNPVHRLKNGSLLQPPFMVKVHTVDGRLTEKWTADAGESPISLSRVLGRTVRHRKVDQLRIVTIEDTQGKRFLYTVFTGR